MEKTVISSEKTGNHTTLCLSRPYNMGWFICLVFTLKKLMTCDVTLHVNVMSLYLFDEDVSENVAKTSTS